MDDRSLRQDLIDRLSRTGVLFDARVRAAMLAAPRHRFIPAVPLTDAYDDRAIAIKEHNGLVLSSISQPGMIAQMLQLLDVQPGDAILEVGTGSGYNAALLASLTGPNGSVTTVDIERDLLDTARTTLADLGISNVMAIDASQLDVSRQFDRIVVTARADDIDDRWWRCLRDGGTIVVPLDIGYGGERAVGFVRHGNELRSTRSYACAFIGMRSDREESHRESDIFFPNRNARSEPALAHAPLAITAVERSTAQASIIEGADVVVARPVSIFAIRAL